MPLNYLLGIAGHVGFPDTWNIHRVLFFMKDGCLLLLICSNYEFTSTGPYFESVLLTFIFFNLAMNRFFVQLPHLIFF